MRELIDEVRNTIERERSDAEHRISDLHVEREAKEAKPESLKKEIDYGQILMGNDPMAKERTKKTLERERETVKRELDELSQVLPTTESGEQ